MNIPRLEQLATLYDANAARLTLYARQWQDQAGAEDAVQEVFLKLSAGGPLAGASDDELAVWLFRQVRAACSTERRSVWRRRRREERVVHTRQRWFEPADGESLDAAVATAALAELPADQRETLVLRIWGELTLLEMSEVLDEPVSTIFSRYRAGLAALRTKMEKTCQTQMPARKARKA